MGALKICYAIADGLECVHTNTFVTFYFSLIEFIVLELYYSASLNEKVVVLCYTNASVGGKAHQ